MSEANGWCVAHAQGDVAGSLVEILRSMLV